MENPKYKWDKKKDLSYLLMLAILGSQAIDPKNNKNAALILQKKSVSNPPKQAKPIAWPAKIAENRPKHESIHNTAHASASRCKRGR